MRPSGPTADAGGPYTVDEGSSITVTATGTDPDGDPVTFAWDLDNDGTFETAGQSATFSAAALDGPRKELIAERPGAVLEDFAVLTSPELPNARAVVAWTRHAVGEITAMCRPLTASSIASTGPSSSTQPAIR